MGVVCGKPSRVVKDSDESTKHRELNRNTSEIRAISSRREESFRVKKRLDSGEIRANLIDKKANGSRRVRDDHYEKEKENSITGLNNFSRIFSLPKAAEGEQVAAGWPSWFAQYAGEAIKGWIPRKADTFEKLDKIGQGTYSSVYKAKDLKHDKLVALKRVRFDSMDPESIKFMAREILILRRLDHQNIVKLEGLVTSRASSSLYLVFEYMEHDLTGLASLPGVKFTEPQIKCYMQQLLSGLHHCHSQGVLHRDIKGSNLLIDNNGILKIADFGLASFFDHRQRIPLTSRVVTLWYRPPELLLGASHYGVAVDLWSTGCILGELFTGKPIMPGKTEVEQLHKIFKLCGSPSENYWRKEKLLHSALFKPQQPYRRRVAETFRDLPAAALGLLETLLSIDPADRGTAAHALKSEFFTTEPYACDPSSLPKYPPSKEIDAKIREEEARRQGALGNGQKGDYESRRSKELHAVPAPEANAESAPSMQRRHGHSKTKSRNELFNPQRHQAASDFPFDPPRPSQATSKDPPERPPRRITHSGPLAPGVGWIKSGKKFDDISITSTRADFSSLSGLAVPRALLSEDSQNDLGALHLEVSEQKGRLLQSFQEPVRKQDQKHQGQHFAGSHQIESGRTNPRRRLSHGRGWKANKIHFSGPIMGPLNNMDEMLKERDRKIQEAARRARQEKTRRGMQITANPETSAVMEQGK